MTDPFEIVVSGHLCIDLIPQMSNVAPAALATSGKLFEVGAMQMSTGGCVSNTGLALQRLGVRTGLMAVVGDDLLGQATRALLAERDPALCDLITVQSGEPSSYSVVLTPGGADRTFLHCTGTNSTFNAESVAYDLLDGVKIFHLGYPPLLPGLVANTGEGLRTIFERVKTSGIVTSMDMVVPDPHSDMGRADWRAILRATLPFVDVFLPSIDEIRFMLRPEEAQAAQNTANEIPVWFSKNYLRDLADELLAMGVAVAGFKLGAYGMYLKTAQVDRFASFKNLALDMSQWAQTEHWQPAFQVEVRGTTGAGDSAYAGFLTALLHRQSPEDALRWACALGACNVEAADSTSGVQTLPATLDRLRNGWPERSNSFNDNFGEKKSAYAGTT